MHFLYHPPINCLIYPDLEERIIIYLVLVTLPFGRVKHKVLYNPCYLRTLKLSLIYPKRELGTLIYVPNSPFSTLVMSHWSHFPQQCQMTTVLSLDCPPQIQDVVQTFHLQTCNNTHIQKTTTLQQLSKKMRIQFHLTNNNQVIKLLCLDCSIYHTG